MFESRATEIRGVRIDADGAALREILGLADELDARISEAVAEFDAAVLWELDAATSMTSWLRHEARMSGQSAATVARTADALRTLPATAAAWRDGVLTGDQVHTILANVPKRHRGRWAEHEAEVVPTLTRLDVWQTKVAMGLWRQRADALDPGPAPADRERSMHLSQTLGGRFQLSGSLDAGSGGVVAAALGVATTVDADGELRGATERRADALVDVCQWFLDNHQRSTTRRNRPHVNVIIGLEDLEKAAGAEMVDVGRLDPDWVRTLLCDCNVHRVLVEQKSVVIDYGRSSRTVPEHLWKLLVLRDKGCRHPGCDRGPSWCDAHHVVPWEAGGETVLSNLVLKCSRHHHMGHLPGWHDKLLADGTLEVTHPDGRVFTSRPPGLLP